MQIIYIRKVNKYEVQTNNEKQKRNTTKQLRRLQTTNKLLQSESEN